MIIGCSVPPIADALHQIHTLYTVTLDLSNGRKVSSQFVENLQYHYHSDTLLEAQIFATTSGKRQQDFILHMNIFG